MEQSLTGDSLFSEAEKIGIDVREDTGAGLTFNFFEDDVTANPVANLESGSSVNAVSVEHSSLPLAEDDAGDEPIAVPDVVPLTLPSLSFVISGAFAFHRDM